MKDRYSNRYSMGAIIVLGIAFLLVFGLVIYSFYFHSLFRKPEVVSFNLFSLIFIILVLITVLILIILARYIFLVAKQGKVLEIQNFYIEHLNELVRAIRAQRHDFVNHLQVVYALMRTDKIDKAQQYIEDLCQQVRITGEILQLNVPELSALFLAKEDLAATKKISFKIIVDSNLDGLSVKPLDLIAVVGNLIDNAFDAVEPLPDEDRKVFFKIFETPKFFVFQTVNPGYLPQELREKIFQLGFSTKKGSNRGIGLASVKSVVERYNGRIIVSSSKDRGTKFTVLFPVNCGEE